MNIEILADAFASIQMHNLLVASLRVHPADAHLLNLPMVDKDDIWGAHIYIRKDVRQGTFELRTDQEFRRALPVQIFRLWPLEDYDQDEAY